MANQQINMQQWYLGHIIAALLFFMMFFAFNWFFALAVAIFSLSSGVHAVGFIIISLICDRLYYYQVKDLEGGL